MKFGEGVGGYEACILQIRRQNNTLELKKLEKIGAKCLFLTETCRSIRSDFNENSVKTQLRILNKYCITKILLGNYCTLNL